MSTDVLEQDRSGTAGAPRVPAAGICRRWRSLPCGLLAGIGLLAGSPTGVPGAPATQAAPRQILIIDSFHPDHQWSRGVLDGFQSVLPPGREGLRYHVENMDTLRHVPDAAYRARLAELYRAKYGGRRLDLVVASENEAIWFVLAHRRELVGDAPMVFCGARGLDAAELAGQRRIAGVTAEPDLTRTIALALELHPKAAEVLIVSDDTPRGRAEQELARRAAAEFPNVRLAYLSGRELSFLDLLARMQQTGRAGAAIFLGFRRDRTGRAMMPAEILPRLARETDVPIYSCDNAHLTCGAVGGYVKPGFFQGRQAAQLARELLAGRLPTDVPVVQDGPSQCLFDRRQMERFGIPLSSLPAGRVLVGGRASAPSSYGTALWVSAGTMALLAAAVVLLAVCNLRRRRVERELRGQQRLLANILTNIPHSIFWKDTDLAYLGCNRNFASDMGLARPEDVVGKTDFDLPWPPDQAEACRRVDREVLRTGQAMLNLKETRHRADGSEIAALTSEVPLCDAGGSTVGLLGIYMDVAERKLAAQEHARLEAMLRHSQKMEAIGQLAGGIAHDFNNLLTAIQGNAELLCLSLRAEGEAQQREMVEAIHTASRRAGELTGQLLAFARKSQLQTAPVDLHGTICEAVRLLERSLDKRIEVRQVLASRRPVVQGDAAQLQSALLNLALNARDAMPEGGTITFASHDRRIDEDLARGHSPELAAGPYVELSVTDTGVGMDAATVGRAFEPFFTTKEVGLGTGLGLSIVYGAVRAHRGHVHVDSAPGAGTTVRILLPRAAEAPEIAPALAEPKQLTRGEGHVLVVDDEHVVRDFCTRVLRGLGYAVTACAEGAEALELFRRRHDAIDLVLLDRVMPKTDGLAVLRQLKQVDPDVRVVLCSGFVRSDEEPSLAAQGVLEFLSKPFDVHQLSDVVARHIRAPGGPSSFPVGPADG